MWCLSICRLSIASGDCLYSAEPTFVCCVRLYSKSLENLKIFNEPMNSEVSFNLPNPRNPSRSNYFLRMIRTRNIQIASLIFLSKLFINHFGEKSNSLAFLIANLGGRPRLVSNGKAIIWNRVLTAQKTSLAIKLEYLKV